MALVRYLLVALLLIAVVTYGVFFSLQNTTPIPLDLLFWQLPEASAAVWILTGFVAGGIAGLISGSVALLRLQATRVRLRKKLKDAETELQQLRSAAVK